ncbi:MAG: hypothetical protein CVV58_02680 [Tenericutes bacterium HGW-Tenericutes-3]|nr:MAG: hypothetical protein CVV58_02680 [Tenericutes bacterium HGW-Tenericutes-3]
MIKAIKFFLIFVLSVVILFVAIIVRLYAIKVVDVRLQVKHNNQLESYYQSSAFTEIDDAEFTDFDIHDASIKLNDIQMLASHNSYKKKGSALGKLFIGLGSSKAEAQALNYGYKNLTDQLENGIRSMEIDLRMRKTQFMLTHIPLVDNGSVAPVFSLALEEIAMFSDNNPNHLPIIILMEIKDDWMILDHALQKIEQEQLEDLNILLDDKLGNRLFTPNDMLEDGKTLNETVQTTGWPSISTLLGKIIFILHPGNFVEPYQQIDPTLKTLPMFIGATPELIDQSYTSFIVHNEPDVTAIGQLVSQGYIVRTRIDADLVYSVDDYNDAINSGAQILSSDYTIGRSDLNIDDYIYLPNEKMIVLRT